MSALIGPTFDDANQMIGPMRPLASPEKLFNGQPNLDKNEQTNGQQALANTSGAI